MPAMVAQFTIIAMSSPSRLLALCGALVTLAVAAPAAAADSIAYIKDGDVWLSTGDGSRQFRVTDSGRYADVSQADDGTMIALTGVRLHRLDRQGRVLADFDTPVSDTRPAPAKTFYGPFDPAISPDGKKVAYTYHYMTQSQSPTCIPPTCFVGINEGGTGYSWADRQTGWDDPALGKHSGWRNPSWIDNDTVMISDPTHMPNYDVILDTLSDGDSGNLVKGWFSDMVEGNPHVSGGDITRDRTKMAFATGQNDSTLTVYSVPQFPTAFKDGDSPVSSRPHICYRYSGPKGSHGTPTFSPDGAPARLGRGRRHQGRHRAELRRRLHARRRHAQRAARDPRRQAARLGSRRRAGRPRDPRRRAESQGRQGQARPRAAQGPRRQGHGAVGRPRDRHGHRPRPQGRVRRQAGQGRKATVKLRFSRGARAALDNARSVKLRIKVAFKPSGGAAQRATLKLKLSR